MQRRPIPLRASFCNPDCGRLLPLRVEEEPWNLSTNAAEFWETEMHIAFSSHHIIHITCTSHHITSSITSHDITHQPRNTSSRATNSNNKLYVFSLIVVSLTFKVLVYLALRQSANAPAQWWPPTWSSSIDPAFVVSSAFVNEPSLCSRSTLRRDKNSLCIYIFQYWDTLHNYLNLARSHMDPYGGVLRSP